MAVKDGWQEICGYRVCVIDGLVNRGVTSDGQLATYPYRKMDDGVLTKDRSMTVAEFIAAVRKGTAQMVGGI